MSPEHIDQLCLEVLAVLDDEKDPDICHRIDHADLKRLRSACLKLEEELAAAYLQAQELGADVQTRMLMALPPWA
jgi:hypothetical protein